MTSPSHRELLDPAMLARLSRLTLQARSPMLGTVSGLHRSATRGSSVEFAEYRKYVQGDDIRHLDWRVIARTDRYYMKEFEADTNLRAWLLLDASGSMGFRGTHVRRFDFARRLAASLAWLLAQQGDAVGLMLCAQPAAFELPPRRSPAHLKLILDALRDAEPAGDTALVEALHRLAERARRRAMIVVISDCFADAAAVLDGFQHMRFRHHDLVVFQLLDPLEIGFAFDRPMRFDDLEGGGAVVTDPAVIGDDYRAAVTAHLAALEHGCREFGVDYRRVLLDADLENVLAAFVLSRSRAGGGAR
ncbi:MAG: DUF58 domain-containing protein [Kiritimatiellae bacterium]|nr:DUF58 domain-containing protein [Kiritimatiellia bacterium]